MKATATMAAEDDPYARPPIGLPARQYRTWNQTHRCMIEGCTRPRDKQGPRCLSHRRTFTTYGSDTKKHVDPDEVSKVRQRVLLVLRHPANAGSPAINMAQERLRQMLARAARSDDSALEYVRRMARDGADPFDIIAVTATVCATLYRIDRQGYEDKEYLSAQITYRLLKLTKRKYAGFGEERTWKRTRGCAGAVLAEIGEFIASILAVLEKRRRKATRRRKQPSTTNEGEKFQ
ncbi:MAG: hypothetical protein M9907_11985 [Burkholderiaceae bacterium]|nr:hypothetical protein [Burkholderiaceae bacterium]